MSPKGSEDIRNGRPCLHIGRRTPCGNSNRRLLLAQHFLVANLDFSSSDDPFLPCATPPDHPLACCAVLNLGALRRSDKAPTSLRKPGDDVCMTLPSPSWRATYQEGPTGCIRTIARRS